jgi:hypothetical protein
MRESRRGGNPTGIPTGSLIWRNDQSFQAKSEYSYRLNEKLKAGLVRSQDDDGSQPGGEI